MSNAFSRPLLALALVPLMLSVAFGCKNKPPNPDHPLPDILGGRVGTGLAHDCTWTNTSMPLAGVLVRLTGDLYGGDDATRSVPTDSQGRFMFAVYPDPAHRPHKTFNLSVVSEASGAVLVGKTATCGVAATPQPSGISNLAATQDPDYITDLNIGYSP